MSVRREVKHCKHSGGSLEGLDATLPNDCAFCAHEQIGALADALLMMFENFDSEIHGNRPIHPPWIVGQQARAALRLAGRLS